MKIASKVQFADNKTKKAYEKLNKHDDLHKYISRAIKDLEENAFCGVQIPKKIIPKEHKVKYEIANLWKYNLPNAWRLLYSIESDGVVIISIILEWTNHKNYERRFKY